MNFLIRHTQQSDFKVLKEIYANAREFMKKNGNPNQWRDFWPDDEIIQEDISVGRSYVVVEKEKIYAVFAYIEGVDKTYLKIEKGTWISNEPYGTIHRLASTMEEKGIFSIIISWLDQKHINLRADTHSDNLPMQKQLLKNGFIYCGIIQCVEGGDRLAFERLKK